MLKIKSKAFKFLIGTLAVVALAFAMNVSAAVDLGPTTLKVGSRGSYVMTLQTVVGATPVDGVFGPMTKAKVMAWQANNGLVADGIVGPATKAAMNGATTPVAEVPGCPAGAAFNYLTGAPCTTTPVAEVPGCPAGALFNYMTGASCTGATAPVTGALTGGAGDALISDTSVGVESEVVEGQTEKVLAFRVQADGSDVSLSNLKVTLTNGGGTGSMRIERYISEVAVWDGSTKIGSVSASEFSKVGNVYSKSIPLSNLIVREGSANKKDIHVSVTAISNIDSADMLGDSWDITVDNIRFQDATGVVMTSGYTQTVADSIDFTDLATAGDVKVYVSKGSNNPAAGNVEVSSTGTTSDVLMLEFKLKATGTDMSIDSLKFTLNGTGATPAEAASEIALYNGSTRLGDLTTLVEGANNVIDLYDTFTISAGDTETFKVLAKINKIGTGTFLQGEALKVSLGSLVGLIEDEVGNAVTSISGSAAGEVQTFYSEGAVVKFVSSSFTQENVTDSLDGTISIKFTVMAMGDADVTIEEDASDIVYAVTGATETDAVITSTSETATGGTFTISAGDTKTYTLSAKFNTVTGFVKLAITEVGGTAVSNVVTQPY